MKRKLNTSYRLVWNPVLGAFVVVSELAKSKGKRAGAVLALAAAGLVVSPVVLAEAGNGAETTVPVGEVVNDVTLSNHDSQVVSGEANGTVINTGYEYGDDDDANTGGQFVQDGGMANQTTVNDKGLQVVLSGGNASDTTVNTGGGQSVKGQATGTVLNGGEQWVHSGGVASGTVINESGYQLVKEGSQAIGTVVNTGAQGGPDAENSDGMFVSGTATDTTINANGRQVIAEGGISTGTVIYSGGDQSVHGRVENTTLNGGYQYVHSDAAATDTVINNGGWQVVKSGAQVSDTTVNNSGKLSVAAGAVASDIIINAGGALVTSTAADVSGSNRLGYFSVNSSRGSANNVVLENGGRLDVLGGDSADTTTVDKGGVLAVNNGGTATNVAISKDGALIADSGSTVSGVNANGRFSIGDNSASGLLLENGGRFSVKSGGIAENTTVGSNGELSVGTGGRLSGTTSLTENASLTITGDVISTGTIENAGTITFAPEQSHAVMTRLFAASADNSFTPRTLTTTNLAGQGGTINMNIRLDNPDFPTDMLVIDGGQATGKTWLNFTNAGDAGLGLTTTGNGIKVVDAINGATTEDGAFALANKLQAGAYNYTLNQGTADESWYLTSEAGYRAEVALYASLFAQSMDYDRALAGSYAQRSNAQSEAGSTVWGRIQGGHMGHDNNGGTAKGATPESSGSYGFVQLGSDLLSSSSLKAGVYGAAGHSSVDVKDDDRSRAGTVRDDVYSLGGYLTAIHSTSGLWADVVAQGSRHNLKTTSDANSFDTRGWGWLGSLETGLPFNVTNGLVLEPQLQYIWQGLSLNNGHDNGGYVNFGDSSAQHIRAGLRFGSQSEMAFGHGTSTQAGFGNSMKHSVSELPVNWWVRPSVIRTFSADGDMSIGTAVAGSNITFSPSQDGTSLDMQAGLEALIRQNVTLGVQGGYTRSVSGNSADGYNGQATLKVTF